MRCVALESERASGDVIVSMRIDWPDGRDDGDGMHHRGRMTDAASAAEEKQLLNKEIMTSCIESIQWRITDYNDTRNWLRRHGHQRVSTEYWRIDGWMDGWTERLDISI